MVSKEGKVVGGSMPLMDPSELRNLWDIQEYAATVDPQKPLPVDQLGQVVGADNDEFRLIFEQSLKYREWWIPNDLDMGALYANISRGSSRLTQIAIYRPVGHEFDQEERDRFAQLCAHYVRASRIENRIRIGLAAGRQDKGFGQHGSIVVDRDYRVLSHDAGAIETLKQFRAVHTSALGGLEISSAGKLRRLIDRAQEPTKEAGSCWLTDLHKERIWIDVVPIGQGDNRETNWLTTDRPAALLQYSISSKTIALRVRGLAREFGLTPAEEAVAIEIVKGDGRAATARRLGISESTVRTHLSVIFEKFGVHRQSELIQMLAG
ncbi:MAG: helix-turn-helix transcriptional regulator [Pseudomonadota bacterium]